MGLAIREAMRSLGRTVPNPAVGAVLVKNGRIIAKGFHRAAGLPHAEIEAMKKAGFNPRTPNLISDAIKGCTLYVTLEPCSSQGRTPPCTSSIIASGIKRVVYGAKDPDKRHRGRASKILKKNGIKVTEGILASQCADLNKYWNHLARTGMPWVVAKAAVSLDGRIDSAPLRRWITSNSSRREAMRLRASVQAILVGGGTVRTDDPSLTIRGIRTEKNHPQPWRVVWSRSGKVPPYSKILNDCHRDRTLIFTGMPLRKVLKQLAKMGVSIVLIEGGGRTLAEAFRCNVVNEVRIFIAPVVQGGNVAVISGNIIPTFLKNVTYTKIGSDVMVSGMVIEPS